MKSKIIIVFVFLLSFITYNSSLAQAPAWLSVKHFQNATLNNCKTDKDGNLYACGSFSGTIQFDTIVLKAYGGNSYMFIVKFSPTGKTIWARTTEFNSGASLARAIAINLDGNIYVTGQFNYPDCQFGNYKLIVKDYMQADVFIVKYNKDGEVIWASSVGGACGYTDAFAATADSKGDLYIAGYFQAQYVLLDTIRLNKASTACGSIGQALFIAKYSADGKALWAKNTGGNDDLDWAHGVAVDKKDNVFLTGYFGADYISFDTITLTKTKGEQLYIAKFNSKGKTLWAKTENTNSNAIYAATDSKDNCYIIGILSTELIFGKDTLDSKTNFNACVLKYDSGGNRIWGRAASQNAAIAGYSVTIDSLDNVYIGGWFNKQPFAYDTVTVPCDKGLFITKYDSSGNFNWVKCVETDGFIRSLHCDYFGNIYLAGQFTDTVNFDTIKIAQKGISKFIAKLAPSLITTIKNTPESKTDLLLYPNPCTEELTINVSHFKNVKHLITVYDIHGKAIYQTQSLYNAQTQTSKNAQTTITINTRSFSPGLYLIRIQSPNSTTTRKFIKF
ncbi:MAG: T9SS type A sorting domain-containing protein [Bacteroidales bacterium]|nr:T9SS type A sorting domain-containing protein [Bacteroidales bacterium]